MVIETLEVGPLQTNCFIVGDEKTGDAIVIDPGGDADRILSVLKRRKLNCSKIVLTHSHFDHVGGIAGLKEKTGAAVYIHKTEIGHLPMQSRMARLFGVSIPEPPAADKTLAEGDTLMVGSITLKVLHTPGHSEGSICLLAEKERCAFVGDLLFLGSIGRTDFPGGSHETLIKMVKEKIFTLGDDWVVYPGHGPSTTVGRERRTNPFF